MMYYLRYIAYLIVFTGCSAAIGDPRTDFFRAVQLDQAQWVRQTLKQRLVDPNSRDDKGQVALYVALRESSAQVVEVLLEQPDLDIDATNEAGETPLMMAALRGDVASMRRLLDRGAAPERTGWSPLHYAACGPQAAAATLLLERGVPVDALSPNRSTPLMMAARYGPEQTVDTLLARGASLQLRNERGLDAADFARSAGRDALAARLDAAARR